MTSWLKEIIEFHNDNSWIGQVFLVILLMLCVNVAVRIIFNFLHKHAKKNKSIWDDALLVALHTPLRLFIWVVGITIAADIINSSTADPILLLEATGTIRKVAFAANALWFLVRLVKNIETGLLANPARHHFDKTTITAVAKLLKAAFLITGILLILQSAGLEISGILTFGGIGAAAVALASQDLLSNFFGGLVVYLDKPFKIGDWVRSPDQNIEGTVEQIGWRLTRIRTFDKRPLYVPNSVFTKISVENPSRMQNRRIKTNIGIRYDDGAKLKGILEDVEAMLRSHEHIDTNQTLMVNFVNFGPSSLDFMVYTFTKTTNWVEFQAIQEDVFLKIMDIIGKHGAEIAFPTSTIHVPEPVTMREPL